MVGCEDVELGMEWVDLVCGLGYVIRGGKIV